MGIRVLWKKRLKRKRGASLAFFILNDYKTLVVLTKGIL